MSASRNRLLLVAAAFVLCAALTSPVKARVLTAEGDTTDTVDTTTAITPAVTTINDAAVGATAVVTDAAAAADGSSVQPSVDQPVAAAAAAAVPEGTGADDVSATSAVWGAGSEVTAAAVNQICGNLTTGVRSPCPKPPNYPNFKCGTDRLFSADDYSNFACLANVWEDCSIGGPNAWTADDYCGSCFLYVEQSYKKKVKPGTFFTSPTRANLSIPAEAHVLVIPSDPCTGVDRWDEPNCQDEQVWNYADRSVIEAQGSKVTPFRYIMAINPVSRRTQQQLHVHVGEVWPSLLSSLKDGFNRSLQQGQPDTFRVACNKTQDDCKITNKTSNVINIQIVNGTGSKAAPSSVKPFDTVYGPSTKPKTVGTGNRYVMLSNALGVVRMSNTHFALLSANWAAECYYKIDKTKGFPKDLFTSSKTPKC